MEGPGRNAPQAYIGRRIPARALESGWPRRPDARQNPYSTFIRISPLFWNVHREGSLQARR